MGWQRRRTNCIWLGTLNDRRNNLESQIAKGLAIWTHKDQVDKLGNPYLDHVFHVANAVKELGQDYYVVGLLHDAVEDSKNKKSLMSDIVFYFDKKIIEAIVSITKKDGEDYFEDYLGRVVSNKIALAVKTADAQHNLMRVRYITDKKLRKKLGDKYLKAWRYLSRMNNRKNY